MKSIDWNTVQEAKEFVRPSAGGYLCKITAVEDVPERQYLKMEYDIASGEFEGYWKKIYENKGFWGGSFIKSYKTNALPFFKAFKTCVENSNPNYQFDNDEKTLIGKFIGLVLGEEEYLSQAGEVKTRLYVAEVKTADRIMKNDFEVPAIKKLPQQSNYSNSGAYIPDLEEKLDWE